MTGSHRVERFTFIVQLFGVWLLMDFYEVMINSI